MTMEISHLLEIENGELVTFDDQTAEGEQVRFWLNTPQGSVWGKPWWGHPHDKFKHEPLDENLQVLISMKTISAIRRDLPHIAIRDIQVTKLDVEKALIALVTKKGAYVEKDITGFKNNAV